MKKKIFGITMALLIVACISVGCGATTQDQTQEVQSGAQEYAENMGFELVYESPRGWTDEPYYAYYRDRITDVMYVWVGTGRQSDLEKAWMAGGLSVMLDPETGGPLMYETWLAKTGQ